MQSRVKMWLQDPVTQVLLRVLQDKKDRALTEACIAKTDSERVGSLEKYKSYKTILDIETFFEGELEEGE